MRKTIIAGLLTVVVASAFGQQPFENYGYKVKVATLSKGKYQEFFDQDTLVQIGSVVLNTVTGKLTHFVTFDTTYSEATLQPELISRWLSPDPLAEKYYQLSPYNFVANNPILYTDPDGREVQVTFQNEAARKMYQTVINRALGGQFQVTLTGVKGKEGVFNVGFTKTKDGGDLSKLSKGAQSFYKEFTKMADSKSVVVSMNIVNNDRDVHTGKFTNGSMDMADVDQFQEFDPTRDEQNGPTDAGKVIHETSEQFNKKKGYNNAHDLAISYENGTNGNERWRANQEPQLPRDQGVVQTFTLKNGSSIRFQIIGGQNSSSRGTIILKPVPVTK
jgi:hypothetical protein